MADVDCGSDARPAVVAADALVSQPSKLLLRRSGSSGDGSACKKPLGPCANNFLPHALKQTCIHNLGALPELLRNISLHVFDSVRGKKILRRTLQRRFQQAFEDYK